MTEMLGVIAPLFILVLLGYLAGFSPRMRQAAAGLNFFVFAFALPAFIYTSMVQAPFVGGVPWQMFAVVLIITPITAIALYGLFRLMGPRAAASAAPASLAGTFGNVGYFGIPISIGVLGPEAGLTAGIVAMVHNIFFMNGYPLVRTTVNSSKSATEHHDRQPPLTGGKRLWMIIRRALLLNPVFSMMVLALVVVFTPLQMPVLFDEPVELLGHTAVPLALFCVGLALHPAIEGVRSGGVPVAPIGLATVMKLVALPLLTFAAVIPFTEQLGPVWAGTMIIMAATPSSTTVFLFSEEYDGDGRMAASVLVATTVLSLLSLPLVAELLL